MLKLSQLRNKNKIEYIQYIFTRVAIVIKNRKERRKEREAERKTSKKNEGKRDRKKKRKKTSEIQNVGEYTE